MKQKEYGKLEPEIIKKNLMLVSLFLTAFEILDNSIINRVKSFFGIIDFQNEEFIISDKEKERYGKEVKNLDSNISKASSLWLKKNQILGEHDMTKLRKIKLHRNKIAHEVPKLLIDRELELDLSLFQSIQEILKKVEAWWVNSNEFFSIPDFEPIGHEVISPKEVKTGIIHLLEYLIEIIEKDYKIIN